MFVLSEFEVGSDFGGMIMCVVWDGDEWVVIGIKNWILNFGIVDFYVVFVKIDLFVGCSCGISAFVVEVDWFGFSVGKFEHKLGIKGLPMG